MAKKKDFMDKLINSRLKPRVFKAKDGRYIVIIYRNREEMYDHTSTSTFKEITEEQKEPYTFEDAIELTKGGGSAQEIHFADLPDANNIECKCEKKIDSGEDWDNWSKCKCKIGDDTGNIKILVWNLFVEKE